MSIRFYSEDSGFCGWRVTVFVRGKKFQKKFSAHCHLRGIDPDLWWKYQSLKAHYYHAKWAARAAALNYIAFLNSESVHTKKHRGVGFQGITLGIGRYQKARGWYCYFVVNHAKNPKRIPITAKRGITQSWMKAVDLWGKRFGIRPKDIAEKKCLVPSRRQFQALWICLNEEGKNIPLAALQNLFNEEELAEIVALLPVSFAETDSVKAFDCFSSHCLWPTTVRPE